MNEYQLYNININVNINVLVYFNLTMLETTDGRHVYVSRHLYHLHGLL